ncbi:PEP-CTERM sorting domain-containing protein [Herbaspirillum sp. SJZ107]|uniref:PEP-CTERM sorting domain-containing protein n=1 Tax=Herbaspirillum sp. SJZ107 TaxID=2572881 RepID=UPI00116B32AE|nr:PEP-CTERM sorting domain-containing protein [Herbaspirillum sp. SJZ107]TQK11397.1 putative secreted protein with PEP-CTERM sorting signal [Herbaspirillum sp. SJZ107]
MNWKVSSAVAALILAVTPFASATTISINFEEFAYGVNVGDYYNGGHDSLGRASGAYYGVTINGTVRFTPRGAYLSGLPWNPTAISFDTEAIRSILGTDQYYVAFNAGRSDIDGGFAYVQYENGRTDAQWIAGNGTPNCQSLPSGCFDRFYGAMGAYKFGPYDATSQITSITFNADRVDNILISSSPIGVSAIAGGYEMNRDIPEPASLALFGLGGAALLARRRRNKNPL